MQPHTESFIILFLTLTLFFAAKYQKGYSPLDILIEISSVCEFNQPGVYRPGPYIYSINWCNYVDQSNTDLLLNHLREVTKKSGASFGAEYGSNVRILYLQNKDKFLFNPAIREFGGKTVNCKSDLDIQNSRHRSSEIYVEFTNKSHIYYAEWISGPDACYVQAILENM